MKFIESFDGADLNPRKLNNFAYGSKRKTNHDNLTKIENSILKVAIDENDIAGPSHGRNYNVRQLSHFGVYSARIKIPSAEKQPNVGGVVGFFTYCNDKTDISKNGIYDNSEIDFEWLIAEPRIIYLTAWTDYQEFPDGTIKFGKVTRIINLATGEIISTKYRKNWKDRSTVLTGNFENRPKPIRAVPGYDASKNFYTYGFDWRTDSIRWWIINSDNPDEQITLWDYRGPAERITQKPSHLCFNIWHTNNWSVETNRNSKEKPNGEFWAELDWIKFEPFQ